MDIYLDLAQEASQLSDCYSNVTQLITNELIRDYVPYSWTTLIQVKREYYTGLAHYHAASGILHKGTTKMTNATKEALINIHEKDGEAITLQTVEDKRMLGKLKINKYKLFNSGDIFWKRLKKETSFI